MTACYANRLQIRYRESNMTLKATSVGFSPNASLSILTAELLVLEFGSREPLSPKAELSDNLLSDWNLNWNFCRSSEEKNILKKILNFYNFFKKTTWKISGSLGPIRLTSTLSTKMSSGSRNSLKREFPLSCHRSVAAKNSDEWNEKFLHIAPLTFKKLTLPEKNRNFHSNDPTIFRHSTASVMFNCVLVKWLSISFFFLLGL